MNSSSFLKSSNSLPGLNAPEYIRGYVSKSSSHVQGCLQWSCASLGSQAGLFNHHVLSEGSGQSGSSCAVSLHRSVRILLSSSKAGQSPYTLSGGSGLSGSSYAVLRLDTGLHSSYKHRIIRILLCSLPTQDYPDPPIESRGLTQPLYSIRRIRTIRILLLSPEAGHSPYTESGGYGLSGSSC